MASGLFRLAAGLGRNVIVATTCATLALPVVMVLGGFIVARGNFYVYFAFAYGPRNILRSTFLIGKEKLIFSFLLEDVHSWWLWGYWVSPMMYGQNAIAVNEFLGNSWRHVRINIIFLIHRWKNVKKFHQQN